MTEFEKELVRFVSGYLDAGVSAEDYVKAFSQRLLDSIGRQSKEQPVCEDLKKRASEIYPNKEGDLCSLHSTLQRGGYIRGYQDCKEQMMKEAVEGYILGEIRNQEDEPYEIYAESDFLPLNGKFKMGDKVKIIIVKEEGKHV